MTEYQRFKKIDKLGGSYFEKVFGSCHMGHLSGSRLRKLIATGHLEEVTYGLFGDCKRISKKFNFLGHFLLLISLRSKLLVEFFLGQNV